MKDVSDARELVEDLGEAMGHVATRVIPAGRVASGVDGVHGPRLGANYPWQAFEQDGTVLLGWSPRTTGHCRLRRGN
jgi:hypothetical protein